MLLWHWSVVKRQVEAARAHSARREHLDNRDSHLNFPIPTSSPMTSLWRLRPPVRSFRVPGPGAVACRFNSTKTSDPLRILFCGSDEFSIASLRAVHKRHKKNPNAIASIDVVHRPGKLTGRGLKTVREGTCSHIAQTGIELTTRCSAHKSRCGRTGPHHARN